MTNQIELTEVRREIEYALGALPHDRWLLGAIRGDEQTVIADSAEPQPHPLQCRRPLARLARHCLRERSPLAVSGLAAAQGDAGDWESEWPALLYAPITVGNRRPVGLLTVGSRRPYWYVEEQVSFVRDLAEMLVPFVAALRGGGAVRRRRSA